MVEKDKCPAGACSRKGREHFLTRQARNNNRSDRLGKTEGINMKKIKKSTILGAAVLIAVVIGIIAVNAIVHDKKPLKVAYVCKMLSNSWFVQEEMGIKKACEELGFEYVGLDSNLNDEQCLSDIDSAFAQNCDILLLCTTNQSMGPNIAERCAEEGVVLITLDDNIVDQQGSDVTHVGMPTKEVGVLGGTYLGNLASERNYFTDGNNVKVIAIDVPTTTVIGPRIEGYKEGLMATTPLKEEDFIIVEAAEGMYEDDIEAASPVIIAHPEVTHWIICGANDDCAIAIMAILEEQGFNMDNTLACGLGGYEMSLAEFKKGNPNYISIVLRPDIEGYKAVYLAHDYIVNGTEMPALTEVNGDIATSDTYLDFYPGGKMIIEQ